MNKAEAIRIFDKMIEMKRGQLNSLKSMPGESTPVKDFVEKQILALIDGQAALQRELEAEQ